MNIPDRFESDTIARYRRLCQRLRDLLTLIFDLLTLEIHRLPTVT